MPSFNRARQLAGVCLVVGLLAFTLLFFAIATVADQNLPLPAPNSDATYQALRNLTLSGEAVSVTNFELKRDAGIFHLRTGTVCFVNAVQGKVTGAVFVGDGSFVLDPPIEVERKSLKLLTKENEFSEKFEHLVLRSTDSTYVQINNRGHTGSVGCDAG